MALWRYGPQQNGSVTGCSDPFVDVKIRKDIKTTKTVFKNLNPVWDESFEFHVEDPSSVVHVAVYDEDYLTRTLLGQWRMTMKWFVMNPTYCAHGPDLTTTRDENAVILKGWFPLLDSKFQKLGKVRRFVFVVGFKALSPSSLN